MVEARFLPVLTNIVEEGIGYTILPPSAIHAELQQDRLEIAAFAPPGISREVVLASATRDTGLGPRARR